MKKAFVLVVILIACVTTIVFLRNNFYRVWAQGFNTDNQDDLLTAAKRSRFQYAVKFVCGKFQLATDQREGPVKPGNYATAVNIHNPSFKETVMVKKAVLSLREPEQGKPSQFRKMVLFGDGATEADCPEIRRFLGIQSPEQFIKGFFVIFSSSELDVVPVYTAQSLDASGNPTGMSIDVETVQARKNLGQ